MVTSLKHREPVLLLFVTLLNCIGACLPILSNYPSCDDDDPDPAGPDPLPNIMITECPADHITFKVDRINKEYEYIIIEVVCTNQSSSKTVKEGVVASTLGHNFIGNTCNSEYINYLEAPDIECSLQGCGLKNHLRRFASTAVITCYRASTSTAHSSTVYSSPMTNNSSLYISTYSSIMINTTMTSEKQKVTRTSNSNYFTEPRNSNSDLRSEPMPSANSISALLLSSTTTVMTLDSSSIAKSSTSYESLPFTTSSSNQVATFSHSPNSSDSSAVMTLDSSSIAKSSTSYESSPFTTSSSSQMATFSSSDSSAVFGMIVVFAAVVIPILFVGILCALMMSGYILYTKNDQTRDIEDSRPNYKKSESCILDLKLGHAHSVRSVTTIFQELHILQDADNTGTISAVAPEMMQSCISSAPSNLESSQHQLVELNIEEDSPANTDNPTTKTVIHPVEFNDRSIAGEDVISECVSAIVMEEVNCEWDKTRRPRSTDLTHINYQQQCNDGYHGSVTSYISP